MTDKVRAAAAKALHVIEPDGTIHTGSHAVLQVYRGLGWRITAAVLWHPPMNWPVELGYRCFAGNRRFFARFVFWKPHPDVENY